MKRSCRSIPMHINGLPEDIAANILTRVPIREAVRTSIISKKWRYAWRKLTQLVFDDRSFDESIRSTKSKLISAIYRVLFLHRGPLQKFTLALSGLESCSEIDLFMLVVLEAGVKEFTLRIGKGEPYRLPFSIYAYGQQLELLVLQSCVIKPPPGFEGFSKLKKLQLWYAEISDNLVSSLIRNCPLLEVFDFSSSTKCSCLQIFSPNLKKLFFNGLCETLCFVNTPKLEYIQIFTSAFGIKASTTPALRGRLPVRELEVDYLYSKAMIAMSLVANSLSHLKVLTLAGTSFGIFDEVLAALCLIRNCKNLEVLTVKMSPRNNTRDIELEEVKGFMNVTLEHLREMKLWYVSGMNYEMQFIELILAKSPVLEKFVIEPAWLLDEDDYERLKFFEELSRFRRASPLVEVFYEGFKVSL